jgi:isoquinoline 1-oxidoreductase beta subunit
MEPLNCVAIVDGNKCKLIHGSQIPPVDQLNAAKIVGNLPGAIEVETLFAGGSFGRRANFQSDYAAEAVQIAKKVGKGRPVKLIWTREDDMHAGYYRPIVHHTVRVTLGQGRHARDLAPADRHPVDHEGLAHRRAEVRRHRRRRRQGLALPEGDAVVDAQMTLVDSGVPVLWWRSVGATHTAFVMEHTVDQLAKAAGKDPVEYRARSTPRRRQPAPGGAEPRGREGRLGHAAAGRNARGVAVHESFGSVVAQIADVKLVNGEPRVGRVVTAIDCGTAISPTRSRPRWRGGTCYGLSAALFGKIDLKNGEVQQANFDGYRVLRHSEAPTVETYIVPLEPAQRDRRARHAGDRRGGRQRALAMGQPPTTSLPFVKA